MKKRIISVMLAIAMVLPVFCIRAFAVSGVAEGDGIAWSVDDNYALIVSGEGEMEHHSPAGGGWGSWIAKNITAETGWKIRENSITSILVKSGITLIGDAAFAHCSNSLEAVIEEGVVEIGYHAFMENSKMTKVTIPASVKTICPMAFYLCGSLTDVYYGGTEVMWKEISIGRDNKDLLNATIHFTEEEPEETVPEETVPEETVPDETVPEENPDIQKPTGMLGDATGDGKLNYEDALLVLRFSVGLEELPEEIQKIVDVNGDGKVNYEDALKILRVSIGLDTLEPPKENFYDDPTLVRGLMDYEDIYIL